MPITKWAMPKPKTGMALANELLKREYLPKIARDLRRSERRFALFFDPMLIHKERLEYMERPNGKRTSSS